MLLKNILVLVAIFNSLAAFAQISQLTSRVEEKTNSISIAISYGEQLQKNAWFWGISGEYGKKINNLPIGIGGTIMWDQETTRGDNPRADQTFTAAITGSYLISRAISIGAGVGKGFMNDDNAKKTYQFTNGDWVSGIFGAFQFPKGLFGNPVSLSASFEYNISQKETSISFDLAYGFVF